MDPGRGRRDSGGNGPILPGPIPNGAGGGYGPQTATHRVHRQRPGSQHSYASQAQSAPRQIQQPDRRRPVRPRQRSHLRSKERYVNEASRDYHTTDAKRHFVAMSGEFVGTTLFLLFAFAGTQVANTVAAPGAGGLSQLIYISAVFGFSLLVNVWVFYRISGGLFNPAVTFGMVISGQLPPLRGLLLFPAQLLAGMVAAAITSSMFPGPMPVNTTLSNGTSTAQGFFIEAFATSLLVITVLMLAAEKTKATFIAPIGIGIALFVAELATVAFTGGSLNPTRSFGPAVVTRQFPTYHWIYWIGPAFGAAMASGFYRFLKALAYEEANPGQDASDDQDV